jgi:hypothetical protein
MFLKALVDFRIEFVASIKGGKADVSIRKDGISFKILRRACTLLSQSR